jgi:hypothetical protein
MYRPRMTTKTGARAARRAAGLAALVTCFLQGCDGAETPNPSSTGGTGPNTGGGATTGGLTATGGRASGGTSSGGTSSGGAASGGTAGERRLSDGERNLPHSHRAFDLQGQQYAVESTLEIARHHLDPLRQ